MGRINFNNIFTGVKNVANGVEDAFKENPLERAFNSIKDTISGIGGRKLPEPGNTIGDFFIPRDTALNEGYDDWERLINYNVTDKEVLDPLVGSVPNEQLVYLFNTARKFNINTELQTLIEGALIKEPPRSFGRITDLNKRKFTYGINDFVNYDVDSMYDDVVDKIEDPTILSFTFEIDKDNSPLFQDDLSQFNEFLNFRAAEHDQFVNSLEGLNSIFGAGDNPYASSYQAWQQVKDNILKFFDSFDTNADTATNKSKSYYIKEISDVNNLDKVWTGEGEGLDYKLDHITVKMVDDVKMSVRNMAMFYNTLTYHRQSGKQLIPENLLRFNMWIKISEVRNFTSLRQYVKGNNSAREIIRAIRKDVTSLYYYVQDCEFDFDNVHTAENQTYSAESPTDYETLTFKIKFRRAYRMFKPTLLYSTTSADNGLGAFVFHVDERMQNPFISQKYYTQESSTNIGGFINSNNLNLPFNALMSGQNARVFSSVNNTPRRRTIVPDGVTKGSALFVDKFNEHTADEIGVRRAGSNVGSFLNTVLNTTIDVAEAALQSEIDTSIRGLKDTFAQKLIRTTNSSLTRLRNDLVRDMKNKIKNEDKIGIPSPTNVYSPTNSNQSINTALDTISRLTGVNFTAVRNNAETQVLNPSLQGRPINVGPLQAGFYNTYSINPNESSSLQDDDRANTINYTDGKINLSAHSTYQETIEGNSAVGLDNIVPRKEPDGDLHPDATNVMLTDFENLHPVKETEEVTDLGDVVPDAEPPELVKDLGDVVPDVEPPELVKDLGDVHPDIDYVVPTPDDDRHPDGEPADLVKDLGDVHPDIDYVVPTPDDDRHPDGEPAEIVKDLGDKHPDVDYTIPSPDDDRHPDVDYVVPSPNDDLHPDTEVIRELKEKNKHPLKDERKAEPDLDVHPDVDSPNDENLLKNINSDIKKNKDQDLGNVNCE